MRKFHTAQEALTYALMSGAVSGKGAGFSDVQSCNSGLKGMGSPAIPADYKNFLSTANGFYWDGIEFFGTGKIQGDDGEVPDLVTYNTYLRLSGRNLTGILVLGRAGDDELLFAYNEPQKLYALVDPQTLDPENEGDIFGDFGTMFTACCNAMIDEG